MVKLKVNGVDHAVTADADTPLLWVLRDEIGLTGTKFGCGKGFCGACSVLLDGQVVRSCLLQVGLLAGQSITTIEGLSKDRSHPVQRAWIEQSVPQCGYCQSGMILAAVALLESKPHPSDEDINQSITNICRCGTYDHVRDAIHHAAAIRLRGSKRRDG